MYIHQIELQLSEIPESYQHGNHANPWRDPLQPPKSICQGLSGLNWENLDNTSYREIKACFPFYLLPVPRCSEDI